MTDFGQRLKSARLSTVDQETGYPMTQPGLAGKLGVTTMAVRHYEAGRRFPMGAVRKIISSLWPDKFKASGDQVHVTP